MTKTYTEEIFENKCPWNNKFQGEKTKMLFVCTAGLLRSPTGAAVATKRGYNARSCGSDLQSALIPFNLNLLQWSDVIFFVNQDNYDEVKNALADTKHSAYDLGMLCAKSTILDIPDQYPAFDPVLVQVFEEVLDKYEKDRATAITP